MTVSKSSSSSSIADLRLSGDVDILDSFLRLVFGITVYSTAATGVPDNDGSTYSSKTNYEGDGLQVPSNY